MYKLLVKTFVKDSENVQSAKVRENYGKFSGTIGIISNVLLFVIKFSLGSIFNSVSVVADSINNLADSASSLITIIAFKLSGKPADEEHPYGHARIEYLAGVFVSFLIILIGWNLILSSVEKIINPVEPEFAWIVLIGLVFSIIIKLWQGMFYKFIGTKIHSATIFANSADSINDVISTSVVLFGAIISKFFNLNLDGYFGLLVAVFIIYSGVKLVIETSKPLLGEAPNEKLVRDIREKVLSYEGILGVHDLMIHSYGAGKIFATVHCEVKCDSDIMESHDLMDNIEHYFNQEMGIRMVIHMDPINNENKKTNGLYEKIRYLICQKYPESSIHDFRVVWGAEYSNIYFDICVPFSEKDSDEKIWEYVTNLVHYIDKNYRLALTIDRISM